MVKKCIVCGKEFKAKRYWNRFCCTDCRLKFNKEKHKAAYQLYKQHVKQAYEAINDADITVF